MSMPEITKFSTILHNTTILSFYLVLGNIKSLLFHKLEAVEFIKIIISYTDKKGAFLSHSDKIILLMGSFNPISGSL